MTAYFGDRAVGATLWFNFPTTVNGIGTTFTGSPALVAFKNSTVSTTLGITLTTEYSGVTGSNHVVIDTSQSAGFYATGNDFSIQVSAGTVGGSSLVGQDVAYFSLGQTSVGLDWSRVTNQSTAVTLSATSTLALQPTVASRTLDVTATGEAGIDWSNMSGQTASQNLSATQIQSVNNLASGSDSINTVATSASTLTTGSSVSGTYASTAALDGVYWQISDTAGTLDMYFEFSVGATGVPTTAVWTGGLTTALNSLKVFAFNWGGAVWDQVGTLNGTTSLVVDNLQFNFTTAHVGTGVNIGLVRLRFQNTGLTSANFYTDQVLCGYTNVLSAAQIATGVWQDATAGDFTVSSSIGKTLYINNVVPGASGGHFIAGTNAPTTVTLSGTIDAINVNTYAEPGQGTPAATNTLIGKINYLFKAWLNQSTQTSASYQLYNSAGTVVDQKAAVSDDNTTFTRNNVVSGP